MQLRCQILNPTLRVFEIALVHSVDSASQPMTYSGRRRKKTVQSRSSERARVAFSSNLQSSSCLSPSSPLSPFRSISLPFISRCNQLLLSEVIAPQTSQGCKVTCPSFTGAQGRRGSGAAWTRGHWPPVAESCT